MDKNLLEYFGGDELAANVWEKKYKMFEEKTPKDSQKRYIKELAYIEEARFVSLVNKDYDSKRNNLSKYGCNRFDMFNEHPEHIKLHIDNQLGFDKILLGGSMLQGIGNRKLYSSLSNCFVLGQPFDSYGGINQKTDEITQVMKRRGGGGLDLSTIRPNTAVVHNQSGYSTGPILFANRYSEITKEVAQFGRRGALMLSIHINHPDSLAFAQEKQDLTKITGANTSIIFSDEFMKAVESNKNFIQHFPTNIPISEFKLPEDIEQTLNKIIPTTYNDGYKEKQGYIRCVDARKVWNQIIEYARNTAEPGIIFEGNWFQGGTDSFYDEYKPVTTNPCFSGNMELLVYEFDTDNLVYKTFESLANYECFYALNPNGNKVLCKVWSNGIKPTVRVKFKDTDIEYICTGDHRHLVKSIDNIVDDYIEGVSDLELLDINKCVGKEILTEKGFLLVESVEFAGLKEVYDFKMMEGVPYGYISKKNIIAHNCSEIPMQAYDSCRLTSVNLYSFIDNPFTEQASFNKDKAYKLFYEQLCICDAIVDLEAEYLCEIINKIQDSDDPEELKEREINLWKKIRQSGQEGRRCGCGFTGLGDMLAAMNLKYNSSKETLDFIQEVFKIKMQAELDATIDLSILYGPFKGFNAEKEFTIFKHQITDKDYSEQIIGNNRFFDMLSIEFHESVERMIKYGRRNVSWSTAAPTGSLSILSQTTSGIEPLFSPYYKRRKKCIDASERVDYIDPADGQKFTEYFVIHPKLKYWIEHNSRFNVEDASLLNQQALEAFFVASPWYKSCANDIHWSDRVEIQSLVQKYTTHAISSTINLPSNVKSSVVWDIYFQSWKAGLKGNTVYRDGSRGGVLVTSDSNNSNNKNDDNEFFETRAPKRPIRLPAKYHTLRYKDKIYSVIIGFYQNKPYELFIASGIESLPEILNEYDEHIDGELVKETKDWYNFESKYFILKEIPDIEQEEKMLSLMISMALRHRTPLKFVIKTLDKLKPIAGSFTNKLIKILSKYVPDGEDSGAKCPECGANLKFENGCCICPDCGWTKC